jgi:hypothetical protein
MTDWERPPAGIALPELFTAWLPAAYAASGRGAPADAPLVRAALSGPGGGAWDIRAEPDDDAAGGDRLLVQAASREPPDVWLRQSAADFRAALEGDPDLPPLLPAKWSVLDLLFLDARDIDLLRQVSGRVLVEIVGRRARRWSLDVAFGQAGIAAGRPRTTIRLDGATFGGLLRGELPPMQPLLDGRLTIEGDRGLAMQLLLLLGSRLGRR